jgi:two-component system response regulator HydG
MPGIDNDEFMTTIKQLLPITPIIVLTGYSSVETYIKALSLGAFECLTKPVKVKDLDRVLKSALEQSAVGNAMLLS